MRFLASAMLLTAFLGAAPAFADGSSTAGTIIVPTPKVKVFISGVQSHAQLVAKLESEGYSKIMLSPNLPNRVEPMPQYTAPTQDLDGTPVHPGWNGTAYKDGKVYGVYVSQ